MLDLDLVERRIGDMDMDVRPLIAELRKLREENARLNNKENELEAQLAASEERVRILRADLARQEDICTRTHWSKPLPKPPEVG